MPYNDQQITTRYVGRPVDIGIETAAIPDHNLYIVVDADIRFECARILGLRVLFKNFNLSRCEALLVIDTRLRL